jgi:predicted lipoprotein with Yx(FWY)xxD motif
MRRTRIALALTIVAALTLAACGSDDDSSSNSTSTSRAASGGKAVVTAATNDRLGRIVVDDKGLTVYTLTDAAGKAVPCEGSCLEAWPPVLVGSGTSATGGDGVKDVGSVEGPDGAQATIAGLPLYTFAGDGGPGDANGEGLNSFGGTWRVVKVSSAGSGSSSGGTGGGTGGNTTTTTTASDDSPDYGY